MEDPIRPANLNEASREELLTIPGLDIDLIDRILQNRPYTSLEQFRRKCTVSSAQFKALKTYLLVEQPIEENEAPDRTEIQTVAAAAETEPSPGESSSGDLAPADFTSSQEPESAPLSMPADSLPDDLPTPGPIDVVALDPRAQPPIEMQDTSAPVMVPILPDAPEPTAVPGVESLLPEIKETQPTAANPAPAAQAVPAVPPTARPAAEPHASEQPKVKPLTRRDLLAWVVATMLVTTLVSVLLTLGIMSMVNGTLTYVTPAQFSTLTHQVDTLSTQAQTLSTDLTSLRTRVDTLDTLSGRMTTVEKDTQAIHTTLDASAKQVAQIQDQITSVNTSIQSLQKSSQTFQDFLTGLKNLLSGSTQP